MDTLSPLNQDFRRYLFKRYESIGRQQRFQGSGQADFEAWQPAARDKLAQILRMPDELAEPQIVREPIDTSAHAWWGSHPDEAFRIERISYQSMPGVRVPAYLLIPNGLSEPAPAILCPPGHGRGIPME